MRIEGPNRLNTVSSSGAARRAGGTSSFSLSEPEETAAGSTTAASSSIGGLDALLALQSIDADEPRVLYRDKIAGKA